MSSMRSPGLVLKALFLTTDYSPIVVAFAGLITALGSVLVALLMRLVARVDTVEAKVEAVHAEVKTGNGLTIGQLVDNLEGRRALEIPVADRTPSEAVHVELLEQNLANQTPPDGIPATS